MDRQKRKNRLQRRIIRDVRLLAACVLGIILIVTMGKYRESEETDAEAAQEERIGERQTESVQENTEEKETAQENPLDELQASLEELMKQQRGQWSIYVKDLERDVSISVNSRQMYAASLIKLFVMEKCFQDMDELVLHTGESAGEERIRSLLVYMIEYSDNESFNELIRLQNAEGDFAAGCEKMNAFLIEKGYTDTGIYHSLSPSKTRNVEISGQENCTSVEDCGALLEAVYRGTCVSEEASEEMLELLLNQQNTSKIPEGVPDSVQVANKTGETDEIQHDAAIVYGPQTDYILCVMSEGAGGAGIAIRQIQKISAVAYEYLNAGESGRA